MSQPDVGDLITELSKLVKTLEESESARADADKARADAEKMRADAEKSRADADKVAADTEVIRASAQVDLETKQIANEKARADNEAARIDKLISQATGAVPDISSLSKNTVSFSEGTVVRQGEAISLALGMAADDIAGTIKTVHTQTLPISDLYIVSNANLLADIVTYRRIKAEADALATKVGTAKTDADTAMRSEHVRNLAATGTALVLASLAGAVTKQVASLFETDVTVTTNATDVPAQSVHAAVASALLASQMSGLTLHHEFARVPDSSVLMDQIKTLIEGDIQLAQYDAKLDDAIKGQGDPEKDLAEAQKKINDPKTGAEEKQAAIATADDAMKRARKLTELRGARAGLTAVVEKTRAFSERITTAPSSGGVSTLASAIAVEAIATAAKDSAPSVLVVGPGKVESNQLVVARRIFHPRLQVSVALSVDYFLVRGDLLLAAGRAGRGVSYMGVVKGDGVEWKPATQIGSTWVSSGQKRLNSPPSAAV